MTDGKTGKWVADTAKGQSVRCPASASTPHRLVQVKSNTTPSAITHATIWDLKCDDKGQPDIEDPLSTSDDKDDVMAFGNPRDSSPSNW